MAFIIPGVVYCNATYDGYLCWPPTPASSVVEQQCPSARLSDTANLAFRRCGDTGSWLGKRDNETSLIGWTNFTPCFPASVQTFMVKVYDNEINAQIKFQTAQITRYMEIVGFSVSFVALLISLFIFCYYRSLRNNRTRIHKSLFSAMVMQVLIRLVVYIDQARIRSQTGDSEAHGNVTKTGIDNMPYVCEGSYILLEYAISAMFMWMFIEGLYLHNFVTMNALRDSNCHFLYNLIGWGIPAVVTCVWAIANAIHYSKERVKLCWHGYNLLKHYWILQGPRLAVIIINLMFLLNIMRVLIVKLRRSENSEVERVRKAAKAALVLLPLLGITNALSMIEAPLDGNIWIFGIWSYTTHFFRSFQGFFIALVYCFLNGEVKAVVKKHYHNYRAMRESGQRPRRNYSVVKSSSDENRSTSRKNSSNAEATSNLLRWFSRTTATRQIASFTENDNSTQEIGESIPLQWFSSTTATRHIDALIEDGENIQEETNLNSPVAVHRPIAVNSPIVGNSPVAVGNSGQVVEAAVIHISSL